MKKTYLNSLFIITTLFLLMSGIAFADDTWNGNDTTGDVWRTGNVGIGVSNPSRKFEVYDDLLGGTAYGAAIVGKMGAERDIFLVGQEGYSNGFTVQYTGSGMKYVFNQGNVGIGTTSPISKLQITDLTSFPIELLSLQTGYSPDSSQKALTWRDGANITGQIDTRFNGTTVDMVFGHLYNGGYQISDILTIKGNGNVGIGTSTPIEKLDINGNINLNNQVGISSGYLNPGYYVYKNGPVSYGMKLQYSSGEFGTMIFGPNQSNRFIGFGKVGSALTDDNILEYMRIDLDNGNVGIGTNTPDNKLDVNGTIRAKEVKVESNWSDFVFEENYNLPALDQVETFIKENKHLPDIPSAKQVEEEGLSMADMMKKQMQKIEELTLYLIEMKKENESQSNKIAALEKQLSDMKK